MTLDNIIEAMLGKKIKSGVKYKTNYNINRSVDPILEIKDMDLGGKEKISFKIWPGEVLGLAGLMGAGQNKIVKSIFGILPKINKTMYLFGKSLNITKPEDCLRYRITMVPEERQAQGLIVDQEV